MKLIMRGSTGCVMGEYDLGEESSEEFNQNLMSALREFASIMQDGDSLTVVDEVTV